MRSKNAISNKENNAKPLDWRDTPVLDNNHLEFASGSPKSTRNPPRFAPNFLRVSKDIDSRDS